MSWRYIAQRATTGEFLSWDLDIDVEDLAWGLSGSGSLRGTISPDTGRLAAPDGRLVLEEWGTYLFAEADGVIRWGGILISSSFEDNAWRLEAAEFSTYPHGVPFLGEISDTAAEPAQVIHAIWDHLQSFPDGNLGVTVVGPDQPTGVRLGKDAVAEVVPPRIEAATAIRDRLQSGEAIYPDWTWPGCPASVPQYAPELVAAWHASQVDAPTWLLQYATSHPTSTEKRPAALDIRDRLLSGAPIAEDWTWEGCSAYVTQYGPALLSEFQGSDDGDSWLSDYISDHGDEVVQAKDAEPYELVWWESTDCGDEIDALAKLGSLDFVERHYWDGDTIRHEIQLWHPRAGRRRDDLVFVQGVNISNPVAVSSNGDDFANEVDGIGSGEGRATLRRTIAERDGRLRRVSVYSDKSVGDADRLDSVIRDELARRRASLRIESVDVRDHPNAPIGSWALGDDVLIDAAVPWLGRVQLWCRITGWSLTGEDTASLELERSDYFSGG